MSLFDVIKYPISNPPTEKELEALPIKIYALWLRRCGFTTVHTPGAISRYYNGKDCEDVLYILQKIIEEYDESI